MPCVCCLTVLGYKLSVISSVTVTVTVQCWAMTTCKYRVAHIIAVSNKRLSQFIWSLVITYFANKAIFVFTITSDVAHSNLLNAQLVHYHNADNACSLLVCQVSKNKIKYL